jgi:hypothetical protein
LPEAVHVQIADSCPEPDVGVDVYWVSDCELQNLEKRVETDLGPVVLIEGKRIRSLIPFKWKQDVSRASKDAGVLQETAPKE